MKLKSLLFVHYVLTLELTKASQVLVHVKLAQIQSLLFLAKAAEKVAVEKNKPLLQVRILLIKLYMTGHMLALAL